ncbi:sterol desaturase family protein [Zhongshania sp.]|uniref:sterol desaturase family protein n=1 Tax=Zhongshania sp. TaxID=1971902 RepID=UPI003567043E
MQSFIRWGAYPIIFGMTAIAQVWLLIQQLPYWPLSPMIAALGISAVALLERVSPYIDRWNKDHGDSGADILHAAFSLTLIFVSAEIVSLFRQQLPISSAWPVHAPIALQIFYAGLILDFGLWGMHWLSHQVPLLWKFHALHHSAERLYWLNGERRHPVSALLLAGPGLIAAVLLGAPAAIIGGWFAIIAVHLAFQHANLNYRIGPLRYLISTAEVHRWHHKRDYQDAQVNFGEFWSVWDIVFGTFRYHAKQLTASEVGVQGAMPKNYLDQLYWPFQTHSADKPAE